MKYLQAISILLILALTAGCDWAKKEPVSLSAKGTEKELAAAQSAATSVEEEMRVFAFEQRAQFAEKLRGKLAALHESVTALDARIAGSTAAVKAEAAPKLAALHEQIRSLEQQLVALEAATPTTWEGIKADSLKAYQAVSDGFDRARQWASEVIAP